MEPQGVCLCGADFREHSALRVHRGHSRCEHFLPFRSTVWVDHSGSLRPSVRPSAGPCVTFPVGQLWPRCVFSLPTPAPKPRGLHSTSSDHSRSLSCCQSRFPPATRARPRSFYAWVPHVVAPLCSLVPLHSAEPIPRGLYGDRTVTFPLFVATSSTQYRLACVCFLLL